MSILHPEAMVKQIVRREAELENKRTRSLARQQWADVIECEAALAECRKLRTWIANEVFLTEPEASPTPSITVPIICPYCAKEGHYLRARPNAPVKCANCGTEFMP